MELKNKVLFPFQMALSEQKRTSWLADKINQGVQKEIITPEEGERLTGQTSEVMMRRYLFDLTVAWPLIEVSPIVVYPLAWHLSEGNPLVMGTLATLSASGTVRLAYSAERALTEIIHERNFTPLKSRSLAFISPVRVLGNFSLHAQMAVRYPEIAGLLLSEAASPGIELLRKRGGFLGNAAANVIEKTNNFGRHLVERHQKEI